MVYHRNRITPWAYTEAVLEDPTSHTYAEDDAALCNYLKQVTIMQHGDKPRSNKENSADIMQVVGLIAEQQKTVATMLPEFVKKQNQMQAALVQSIQSNTEIIQAMIGNNRTLKRARHDNNTAQYTVTANGVIVIDAALQDNVVHIDEDDVKSVKMEKREF